MKRVRLLVKEGCLAALLDVVPTVSADCCYTLNLAERSWSAYRDHYPILKRSGASVRGLLLQRYRIGLILRRLLIQQGDEFAARSRNANLAFADNFLSTEASPVELLVGTAVRPERRALEGDACEQSA